MTSTACSGLARPCWTMASTVARSPRTSAAGSSHNPAKTSTNLGGELYSGNESHPADDVRATAIDLMLQRIGDTTTAFEFRSRWTELLKLSGEQVPQHYDVSYPRELLIDLCDLVHSTCQSLGLKVWNMREQTESTVRFALHRAWTEFRQRPDTFAGYELQVLSTLSQTIASA